MANRHVHGVLVARHCECQHPDPAKFISFIDGESDPWQRDDAMTQECCSSDMLTNKGTIEPPGSDNAVSTH